MWFLKNEEKNEQAYNMNLQSQIFEILKNKPHQLNQQPEHELT